MQNKSYNYVKKTRTFRKGRIRSELTLTPSRGTLTKSWHKLVFGHNPQTLTTGVVRMCYAWDAEHIRYNIRCEHNARTSNVSNMWYAIVKTSWAQPNPILPSQNHFNNVNTHLKCMKQCYNAHVMKCMMIESHFHKAYPKNSQKLHQFWKTSKFIKNPKS